MNYLFTQGQLSEQIIGDSLFAGATNIPLSGASTHYQPGDLLFISESDGADLEYLGGVTASDASSVSFALPLRQNKNASAKLWKPANAFLLQAEPRKPIEREWDSGVAVERALGGPVYSVRIATPREIFDLELEAIARDRDAALIAWLDATTDFGLLDFILVAPDRETMKVRMAEPKIRRFLRPGDRREMRMRLMML